MVVRDVATGRVMRVAHDDAHWFWSDAPDGAVPSAFAGPGWLDVQVNGFAGQDLNDGRLGVPGFEALVRALHGEGVARFLPTVITASPDHMRRCLAAVHAATRASPEVARAVAGVHLEGPFVSPEAGARGAHPAAFVRPAERALFDDLQAAADGAIRIVTLAPEVPGAIDLIGYLVQHGIVVALGHTLADGAAVREAVDAGARLSTHLGNGAPTLLPRHPNVIWEQLAESRLYASAIFDGHHLPEAVMRVFARVKGPERLILTSDAVALAGMPPGRYAGQVGGTVELAPSGRLTVAGTPYLAGSASSLLDGVRVAVGRIGMSLGETISAVAYNPRALLGRDDPDDWTVVRDRPDGVTVVAVIVGGVLVHGGLDD